jgi:hypothetical protein
MPNLHIGLTKSDLSLQLWVDRSDGNQTLLLIKYINFFLQIIKWTFILKPNCLKTKKLPFSEKFSFII